MDDYYHHFLTSMSGVGGCGGYFITNGDDLTISTATSRYFAPITALTMQGPYHNLGLGAFPDQSFQASKTAKGRKKSLTGSPFGTDHVKHRRTRSGCFMCRSRRVKCDETRPICERCKKGNRDCIYPDPPSSKRSRSKDNTAPSQRESPKSSYDGEDDETDQGSKPLETIPDQEESSRPSPGTGSDFHVTGNRATGFHYSHRGRRQSSASSSQDGNKESSPSASTGGSIMAALSIDDFNIPIGGTRADWSHLPPDYQHYLNYFVENITHFHYSIGHDEDDFFGTILPSLAVQHEPLLNALAGFSTYHATLQNPSGKLEDFLKYYNKSVTLLLESIHREDMNNIMTLVTILQLLTIEEYFGDWINLMGHQKAAFQVIRKIFTPDTAFETPIGRTCLDWYSRYDCFVAIMGGFPTDLPKEWFHRMNEYNMSQSDINPDNLRWKISHRSSQFRSISYDMSMLYARGSRGQINSEDFTQEHNRITNALLEWKSTWDAALSNPQYLVADFSHQKERDPNDIVDPYASGLVYQGALFSNTLINTEWASSMIMHLSQSSDTPSENAYLEMSKYAYTCCQNFEAVELWPSRPKGALIPLQPCLSIAALFLPRDSRHQRWLRRKFALLETIGLIHPTVRRMKMAQLFRDPSCAHWWLPNDEGLTPILRAIRTFADERNTAAVNAQYENLREVRHLFDKTEGAGLALD